MIIYFNHQPINTEPHPSLPHLHISWTSPRMMSLSPSLFQCITTLSEKKVFLISSLNLTHLVQLQAVTSHHCYLGDETKPHLSTTSLQAVGESDKVVPEPPPFQTDQFSLCKTCVPDPSSFIGLLCTHSRASTSFLLWGDQNQTQYLRSSFLEYWGTITSLVLLITRQYAIGLGYLWHAAVSCSAGCWLIPWDPFPPCQFPDTLPQAFSVVWA